MPTDAILFSANPSMVDVDDAIDHLEKHDELYWSVAFRVSKATGDTLTFPLFGFMHISGDQVRWRALISRIIPFEPQQYEDERVKPEPWRRNWADNINNTRSRSWRHSLVMTEITPFSFDTLTFEKYGGGPVQRPPEAIFVCIYQIKNCPLHHSQTCLLRKRIWRILS
jgi:hypothetical protein